MSTEKYPGLDPDLANGLHNLAMRVAAIVREKRKCCIHCVNWQADTEICKPAGKRPPAKIIAFGCQSYNEDDIPF
jgi:hypothetical protein